MIIIKNLKYFNYWDINNFYGWTMSQNFSLSNHNWYEDISQFIRNFIENFNEDSDEGYFVKAGIQYPENLHKRDNDLPVLPERIKIEKVEKLVANLYDK